MAWWKPWTWLEDKKDKDNDNNEENGGRAPEKNRGIPGALKELQNLVAELQATVDSLQKKDGELENLVKTLDTRVQAIENSLKDSDSTS